MEQFKQARQLLFNATFFSPLAHTHTHTHTHTQGGLVLTARTYGLICYSLLDRCKTEGKSIDFVPIWLRVDPGATFIFITHIWEGGEAEKCHTCFASRHDNKDHPSQRRSGRWWEANMCSLKSFTKCPPPSASPRARPSPLLAVHSLLVHRHQRFFYLREPFSAAVWFKFPHQRGKPLIALLNEALNPQLLPWNYPASTSKSLQTFRGWMKFKHITLFSHVPPLFARCAAGLWPDPMLHPSFLLID